MPHTFQHTIRVPYAHIDKMGFVYYANYFVYFEMARAELLREVGLPYTEMEDRGVMLPVIEAHCEYKQAARFDDALVVHTRCEGIRRVRLHLSYEVRRDDDLIVTGYTHHVCMDTAGNAMRPIPELTRLIDES